MTRTVVIAALLVALTMIGGVLLAYILVFGSSLAHSQATWGEFGDYFGGVLNPLFAMLAFLAVLISIAFQQREFQASSRHLERQAEMAREELRLLRDDGLRQDLVHVLKDIDARLDALLRTDITAPESTVPVHVGHMVAEAQLLARMESESKSFSQFVMQGSIPGTLVEAVVREVIALVSSMRTFLAQYSSLVAGRQAPVIVYYASKTYRLLDAFEHFEGLPSDTRQFFASVSDPHG